PARPLCRRRIARTSPSGISQTLAAVLAGAARAAIGSRVFRAAAQKECLLPLRHDTRSRCRLPDDQWFRSGSGVPGGGTGVLAPADLAGQSRMECAIRAHFGSEFRFIL